MAIQQRLAIAKCFHGRLAADVRWPVLGLDDTFPYDLVVAIARSYPSALFNLIYSIQFA
eukprot:SAG31_NODE_791_length_12069_cov_22.664411_9_plen_59_part_00